MVSRCLQDCTMNSFMYLKSKIMIRQFKRLATVLSVIFTLLSYFPVNGNAQNVLHDTPSKRVRECFDFNWLFHKGDLAIKYACLLYTSPSPRDRQKSRMPSSA